MRKTLLAALLIFCAATVAQADQLAMPAPPANADTAATAPATTPAPAEAPAVPAVLPARGMHMSEVEKEFGKPMLKHAPVGGHERKHPPITRWDYDGYSVVFEHDVVVDTVVPSRLTPVKTTEGLRKPPPPEPPHP